MQRPTWSGLGPIENGIFDRVGVDDPAVGAAGGRDESLVGGHKRGEQVGSGHSGPG